MADLSILASGCLSGILHPRGFYGRIGLATPKALEHYKMFPALRRRVAEVLADQPPDAIHYQGTVISLFTGRPPDVILFGTGPSSAGDPGGDRGGGVRAGR